jgi:hypothetical protein
MNFLTKNSHKAKKSLSSSLFTTTLLLLAVIVFLFNINFDAFWVKAELSQAVIGEGHSGYIAKWVAGTTNILTGSATVTVNAASRKPKFIEN